MKFSFAIPVCNELNELQALVSNILEHKQEQDEIIILFDTDNGTKQVEDYLRASTVASKGIAWYPAPLNNDFASFKNNFLKYCSGDYIVQIDADELPSDEFWMYLGALFESNRGLAESFLISRRNTVDGLTPEHIQKWGWQITTMDDMELINYPDWQHRIFKNTGNIKWKNKVHEVLEGHRSLSYIPTELFLWHHKDIKRQEKQNSYYDTL